MNELRLSKRLETVASYIPRGSRLADIGSDHAYLPCYACIHGLIKSAIAGEITDGPYKSAREQVKKAKLENLIDVRKGDGLEVISANEVDCITVAGMGGALIANILEAGKEKLSAVNTLILQPNIGAEKVRVWLIENKWMLTAEAIVEEDGKLYEVLVAKKGDPLIPYQDIEREILLGPFLVREKSQAFIKKWLQEKAHWQKVLTQLYKAEKTEETQMRQMEIMRKLSIVEEVLSCEK